ncbi:MAG: metal ABC transporter permease [Planctomycetes bacterium]|nr:metal ABC transporter permease [Planctomycetota bacterium]
MLLELFTDYTLRTVALGAMVLGVVSGMLGSFAVLKRQSLLGDVISHAALPGIALAFLFTQSKAPLVLMTGAIAAGWVATLIVRSLVRSSRTKEDSAQGIVLAVFFGMGLVILTFIQRSGSSSQAGLDKFLFGQAATLMEKDVILMALLGTSSIVVLLIFWKEFKLLTFDQDYAASLGLSVFFLETLFTTLLVVAIVIGLQTVGVVLMSAMVVAPAAAARQWTDCLGRMVGLAAFFGALSGVSGAVISSMLPHLPTGPTIVLCISALVGLSMMAAPNRGILWQWLRRHRNRRELLSEAVLCDLYELALQHPGQDPGHRPEVLRTMNTLGAGVKHELRKLKDQGWARTVAPGRWALTSEGETEARRLVHRGSEERS